MDYRQDYDLRGYSARLSRICEEDGGGWMAEVPELDGCMSDGDTPDEALRNASDAIACWLDVARQMGRSIPHPASDEDYSGKFTLRLPKSLHRRLAELADREGVSLNQLVLTMVAQSYGKRRLRRVKMKTG